MVYIIPLTGAEAQYIMEPVQIKQTKSVKQRLVTEQVMIFSNK